MMLVRVCLLLALLGCGVRGWSDVPGADDDDVDINHSEGTQGRYNANDPVTPHDGVINVHVVPHTHDDVGWLKTVDQYYYGTHNDIYRGGVQYILDTVIDELLKDGNKTFIYVEMAFFKRWWDEQNADMKSTVRKLVKAGQFEFVNAGWCMNDEASVHYTATIDQMSEGMVWLQKEVGVPGVDVTPNIAWQIDPFGHSSAHAALVAQMGLKGLFFARMDYQDYNKRKANKDLEYNWYVEDRNLFTGVMYRHYNEPPGYDFDQRREDAPMVRNKNSPEYNMDSRVAGFVKYMNEQSSHYKSGNIMLTMGGDFCYQNARMYFKNLDILMDAVNKDSAKNGFKMFYSTPTKYMNAVIKGVDLLQNKTDDLFPYANDPHSYWTGYFTSRPGLKRYVRDCNNVLQACKQIEATIGVRKSGPTSEKLRYAMAVAQHHDAVSGTSKQHVADDYAQRLAIGQTDCEGVINKGLQKLAGLTHNLQSCRMANESVCEVTRNENSSYTIIVYNPRNLPRIEYLRIPLAHPHYSLLDVATGRREHIEYVRTSKETRNINPSALPLVGVIKAHLPPLGYTSYMLNLNLGTTTTRTPVKSPRKSWHKSRKSAEPLVVQSKVYRIEFDSDTGAMLKITNKLAGLSGVSDKVTQRFMQYTSNTGDKESEQPSGAYIFRPKTQTADDLGTPVLTDFIPGEYATEIWQSFGDWISQVTRVYYDKMYIEVEWTVGPIPADHGREIITRYETSLSSGDTFYTDSNGREMVKRVLNKQPTYDVNVTEPVAGNYYPVNSRATIRDEKRKMQLTVLNDRSQGAASLASGQVELMVHRRCLKDDHRGVAEPLNETANGRGLIVRGKHWLFYSDLQSYHLHRDIGLDLFYSPVVAVSSGNEPETPSKSFYSSKAAPNPYLNLLTYQPFNDTGTLIRLENTLQANEGGTNISVDLANLIADKKLKAFEELGLAGDRPVKDAVENLNHHLELDQGTTITLKPLQIRTFVVTFG